MFSDRVEDGHRRSFSEGRRAVGDPPYGYARGEAAGTMVIEPLQAEIVREIFRLYLNGNGFMKIAGTLNSEGHRTGNGNLWTDKTVRDIAVNEVYTGKVKYHGECRPGQHEPIIDEVMFQAVREVRQSRERIGGRSVGSSFLLSGLVRCKHCGHLCHTQPSTGSKRVGRRGRLYFTQNQAYYQCGGRLKKGSSFCKCGHIQQGLLETHVVARLKSRFGAEATSEQAVRQLQGEVDDHLREVDERLARLDDEAREKAAALARLQEELNAIEGRKAKLSLERAELLQKRVTVDWLRLVSGKVEHWEVLPFEQRKQLVHYLIDQILVWRTSLGKGRFKQEPDVEVDIVWARSGQALPPGDLPWPAP